MQPFYEKVVSTLRAYTWILEASIADTQSNYHTIIMGSGVQSPASPHPAPQVWDHRRAFSPCCCSAVQALRHRAGCGHEMYSGSRITEYPEFGKDPQGSSSPTPALHSSTKPSPVSQSSSTQGRAHCPGQPIPCPPPSGAQPFPHPQLPSPHSSMPFPQALSLSP